MMHRAERRILYKPALIITGKRYRGTCACICGCSAPWEGTTANQRLCELCGRRNTGSRRHRPDPRRDARIERADHW